MGSWRMPVGLLGLGMSLCWLAVAGSARAETMHLSGYFGFAGEWAFDAYLDTQPKHHWWTPSSYDGPLTVRHVGLCTQQGHPVQAGQATADGLWSRGGNVQTITLSYESETCTVSAALATDTASFMTCKGNVQVPIHIWRVPQETSSPEDHRMTAAR